MKYKQKALTYQGLYAYNSPFSVKASNQNLQRSRLGYDWKSRFDSEQVHTTEYCLLQVPQTCSGANPATYTNVSRAISLGINQPERETYY
jgi:hypothetical protein